MLSSTESLASGRRPLLKFSVISFLAKYRAFITLEKQCSRSDRADP